MAIETKLILPKAINLGELKIGEFVIPCAVLEEGTRLLTQEGMLTSLGRANRGIRRSSSEVATLPPFLAAKSLEPFIDEGLKEVASPIRFALPNGGVAYGYAAELLPEICNVFLAAREAGALTAKQLPTAKRCEILVRGLAKVGIIALVDEATGYQYDREKDALEQILSKFIAKELSRWVKRFPNEYYEHMIRLWGWTPRKFINRLPPVAGKITNNLVYSRLAPGVLQRLQELNPIDEKGRRKTKHHQWLTTEFGVEELRDHLIGLVALMKAAKTKAEFLRLVDLVFKPPNTTLPLPFNEPDEGREPTVLALPGVKPRDAIKAFMQVDPKKIKS